MDSLRKEPVADRVVSRSPIQWKLLLSLPEGSEEADLSDGDRGRFMSFVIKEKFKRGMYPLPNSIPQGLKKKVIFFHCFSLCISLMNFLLGWQIYCYYYCCFVVVIIIVIIIIIIIIILRVPK